MAMTGEVKIFAGRVGAAVRGKGRSKPLIRNLPGRKTEKPPFGGFSHGFLSFGICGIGFLVYQHILQKSSFPMRFVWGAACCLQPHGSLTLATLVCKHTGEAYYQRPAALDGCLMR